MSINKINKINTLERFIKIRFNEHQKNDKKIWQLQPHGQYITQEKQHSNRNAESKKTRRILELQQRLPRRYVETNSLPACQFR